MHQDPITDHNIYDKKEILDAARKYCADLLTNRSPQPLFESEVMLKDVMHEVRMEQAVGEKIFN